MKIKQFKVNRLFGLFNHVIQLKTADQITIIHGPNGYGKTALLRLIDSFFNSKYSELRQIPFKDITFDFSDGTRLHVERHANADPEPGMRRSLPKLTFTRRKSGTEDQTFTLGPPKREGPAHLGVPLSAIDDLIPELSRVGSEEWRNSRSGEVLSIEEVVELYGDQLPGSPSLARLQKEPPWLTEIKKHLPVRFVRTQRLLSTQSPRRIHTYQREYGETLIPAVAMYSNELAASLKSILAEYGSLSQSLDSTFPTRLVKQTSTNLTVPQIREKLAQLDQKRARLMETGLLDKERDVEIQQEVVSAKTKNVLSVYVDDIEKKLSVFDQFAAKIDLIKNIINSRFLFKTLTITKEHGFVFTAKTGDPLSATDLSSGEQHELVLLYELLFKVKPDSLILIDEPEISLHVGWQVEFLKDLREVTRLSGFDVMIATHSPQIINDRWDLTVELKGPVQ